MLHSIKNLLGGWGKGRMAETSSKKARQWRRPSAMKAIRDVLELELEIEGIHLLELKRIWVE